MSQETGQQHIKALKNYLDELRCAGSGLPSRAGKVNTTAVATACGFIPAA